MIAISWKFLAGRYHATAWGRHVNEGAVDWPPSPWRIMRAMVAVWKRTLPDVPQEQVEPIFRALATPPEFVLPRAATGHTRHFMPWFKKGPADRTLVFDAFVAVPRDASLLVRWPEVSFGEAERALLGRLLGNLNSLGRSESWCEAKIVDGHGEGDDFVCRPLQGPLPSDCDLIRLLCPDPHSAFADDHVITATSHTMGREKDREVVEKRSILCDPPWNLCLETLLLREPKEEPNQKRNQKREQKRWSDPPGSRWVEYARPRKCFQATPRRRLRGAGEGLRFHVVRYALDSTVLPLVTETLPVAEACRRALMGLYGRLTEVNGVRGRSAVLSGKDDQGQPLTGHGHAYYLPTDEDGDGRLDHLTIYSASGFGPEERTAFYHLSRLQTGREGEDRHPLRLLLLGMGTQDEYSPGPLRAARTWISATPYVATRYAKTRGRHRIDLHSPEARVAFLQDDLRAQLACLSQDLAAECAPDVTIEPLWDDNHVFLVASRWRPIQFKRFRRKAGEDGRQRLTGAFRLRFSRPVRGPMALGWSSHFGLGLFIPDDR